MTVIKVDFSKSKASGGERAEECDVVSLAPRTNYGSQSNEEIELHERIARIKASIDRINVLMRDLRNQNK
jgi:hypothetical protein